MFVKPQLCKILLLFLFKRKWNDFFTPPAEKYSFLNGAYHRDRGFPGVSAVKTPPGQAGDLGPREHNSY